jgi:hypothetical protein
MLVPFRLRLAPGLSVASAVPVTVFLWCLTLAPLMHGSAELSHTVDAAGPFAALVALALLVELPLLSLALASTGMERKVPLAVMLGMATLPWMLGLMGTEVLVERATAVLPHLDEMEAGLALAASTGQAMAPRLLGAFTSAALLLGLALGLALARFGPTHATRAECTCHRARGLLLASGVCASLASVALVGAMEARHLFELLTGLAQVPESGRQELVTAGLEMAAKLRTIRWACTGVLAVLGFTLLVRRTAGDGHSPLGWSARLVPAAAVAALLVLDAHPVSSVTARAPVAIPAGQGVHLPGFEAPRQPSRMNARMAIPTSTPTPSTATMTRPSELRTTGGNTSSGSGWPNAS